MEIKLLGRGCKTCARLEKDLKLALKDLDMDTTIIKVTEINDILSYGVMSTPALVINGKVLFAGMVPSRKALKEMIIDAKGKE